jgi:hypothetical protein
MTRPMMTTTLAIDLTGSISSCQATARSAFRGPLLDGGM